MKNWEAGLLGYLIGVIFTALLFASFLYKLEGKQRASFEKEAISNGVADYKLETTEGIPKVVFFWKKCP